MSGPLPYSVTGTPIAADPDPNVTPPAAGRIWSSPPHVEGRSDAVGLVLALKDGTSATGQLWERVDTTWQKVGAPVTVTQGTISAPVAVAGGDEDAAALFFQVSAVAGAPTTLYAGFSDVTGAGQTVTVTGGATSANQTSGAQKTQIVDAAGTHTQPAGDAPARPVFVNGVVASTSTDAGQNLSLADTAAHNFASAVATLGVMVSCPLANTAAVYIGLASGVTSGSTGKGVEIQPGDREFFPGVLNANLLYAITGTATQNVHALAI